VATPGIGPLLNGCLSVVEFSSNGIGRIYFVIVIHVQEMAANLYGDCVASPPPLRVWLVTVWTSGYENVDIKNCCVENIIVIGQLKSVKNFCLWRNKR
jgi:hypothetical protein